MEGYESRSGKIGPRGNKEGRADAKDSCDSMQNE